MISKANKAKAPAKAKASAKAKAAVKAPAASSKSTRSIFSAMDEIVKRPVVAVKKPMRKLKPGKRVKPQFKRVPPRIVQKVKPVPKPQAAPAPQIDTAKAVAFAMSIAQEMKASAAKVDQTRAENDIHLSRRPVTRTHGEMTVKFSDADLADFRKRLLSARQKAMGGANAMRSTGFNESEDREADGGDGTNQTLRLQALGQMGVINRTLQQIEEALHRVDDGTYGVCTVCGQLIRKPRLLNQPFVLTCMECQNEMERRNR